jgi:hypothetical protein
LSGSPKCNFSARAGAAPAFQPDRRAGAAHTPVVLFMSRTAAKASSESRPARRRKLRVDALIRQAEKAGKVVTSITTPDGVTLRFDPKDDGVIQTADDELARWRKGRQNAHSS